jgi:hypothetical protein
MKQHAPKLVTTNLRALEGQRVKITLRDGSCLHDYELVSAPRSRVHTLWLFGRGGDVFVAAKDISAADGDQRSELVHNVGEHRPEVQVNAGPLSHTRA